MKYSTRFCKIYDRFDLTQERHLEYTLWKTSKLPKRSCGWTHLLGRNRSCINVRLAGYIARHRQIRKCFMKGWN